MLTNYRGLATQLAILLSRSHVQILLELGLRNPKLYIWSYVQLRQKKYYLPSCPISVAPWKKLGPYMNGNLIAFLAYGFRFGVLVMICHSFSLCSVLEMIS